MTKRKTTARAASPASESPSPATDQASPVDPFLQLLADHDYTRSVYDTLTEQRARTAHALPAWAAEIEPEIEFKDLGAREGIAVNLCNVEDIIAELGPGVAEIERQIRTVLEQRKRQAEYLHEKLGLIRVDSEIDRLMTALDCVRNRLTLTEPTTKAGMIAKLIWLIDSKQLGIWAENAESGAKLRAARKLAAALGTSS